MKVTRDTPEQLIVGDTPWLIAVMICLFILIFVGAGLGMMASGEWMGLIFVVAGGGLGFGALAAFMVRVQVIFDRPTNALIMRKRNLFGYSEVRHALSDLSEAVLESTTGSKGSTLYRPVLVLATGMSAGRHPIVAAYTNTSGPRRVVEAVNRWLTAAAAQETAV